MTNTTKAHELLAKAADHMADRAATYDKPEGERSMGRAVQAFNAITGRDLSEPEGWLLLQVLKDVRLFQRPGYHADSAEDCIAYAALKAEAKADKAASGVANGSDGWIKWDGGKECPVHPDTVVEVALRLDAKKLTSHAWKLNWEHHWWEDDVMAYRVVQEASEAAPAAAKAEQTKPDYRGHELYGLCRACKHRYVLAADVDPCKSCWSDDDVLPLNWEPAEDKE